MNKISEINDECREREWMSVGRVNNEAQSEGNANRGRNSGKEDSHHSLLRMLKMQAN
jgi:hypothetical protein